ncbi:MAG: hypothetical protein ACRDCC_08665 [Culicoidibacterales bacterium]
MQNEILFKKFKGKEELLIDIDFQKVDEMYEAILLNRLPSEYYSFPYGITPFIKNTNYNGIEKYIIVPFDGENALVFEQLTNSNVSLITIGKTDSLVEEYEEEVIEMIEAEIDPFNIDLEVLEETLANPTIHPYILKYFCENQNPDELCLGMRFAIVSNEQTPSQFLANFENDTNTTIAMIAKQKIEKIVETDLFAFCDVEQTEIKQEKNR